MATSFSILNGFDGFRPSDITVGASAPGTGDIELRLNATDGAGNTITRKGVIIALYAFIRALESGAVISNAPPL